MACGFALCGNGERYASDERNVAKKPIIQTPEMLDLDGV